MTDLNPRRVAADLLDAVLRRHRALDEAMHEPGLGFARLADRDRAFVRRLVATCLRRLGQVDAVLKGFVKIWPKGLPLQALRLGLCELLFLDTPPHAAVSSAVELLPAGSKARGLVNAVLRRAGREGAAIIAGQDAARLNTPVWLRRRWEAAYGADLAQAIMTAHQAEAALDISTKPGRAATWAEPLNAVLLPSGSLRRLAGGAVESLPGFADQPAEWWVQDAAAALPARLFGADLAGRQIADLCAAPGGKTAQLLSLGAEVFAIDRSEPRLQRLKQNLARLGLKAQVRTADATVWQAEAGLLLDGVLVDAPCSATGTIRRHPELPYLKQESDLAALTALQRRLLQHAITLLKPGGLLVYATCSLEPEEGEAQRDWLLAQPELEAMPIQPAELGLPAALIDAAGSLRCLPCHWPEHGGIDGFFAARFRKR
ncbi:transcription antitermination factor NusB [Ferrovibrio sp.]|uniref:RsmB/NOP family class I SAM-dependent RNA methyltransferase n=1 Tax=Ferrovibrio sp. TaxID=1917215 RepID=UPI001B671FFB|nr:transcription antitermination factor NusB [Ferrovibrio sp.]MBP7063965.1 MFS transporter [Ferrovibrio sp.]